MQYFFHLSRSDRSKSDASRTHHPQSVVQEERARISDANSNTSADDTEHDSTVSETRSFLHRESHTAQTDDVTEAGRRRLHEQSTLKNVAQHHEREVMY